MKNIQSVSKFAPAILFLLLSFQAQAVLPVYPDWAQRSSRLVFSEPISMAGTLVNAVSITYSQGARPNGDIQFASVDSAGNWSPTPIRGTYLALSNQFVLITSDKSMELRIDNQDMTITKTDILFNGHNYFQDSRPWGVAVPLIRHTALSLADPWLVPQGEVSDEFDHRKYFAFERPISVGGNSISAIELDPVVEASGLSSAWVGDLTREGMWVPRASWLYEERRGDIILRDFRYHELLRFSSNPRFTNGGIKARPVAPFSSSDAFLPDRAYMDSVESRFGTNFNVCRNNFRHLGSIPAMTWGSTWKAVPYQAQ